jgi:geranylgeranyl diphosphate synthase type I
MVASVELVPDGIALARAVLTRSRGVLEPALRDAVQTLPRSMQAVAGYHFGWLDESGRERSQPSGKALRPALSLLCAEAVGGSTREAMPAAVAVELVHNFSLLHDDVMDGDVTRRHRPTAWSVFGRGSAILAGDSLLTLAMDVVAGSGHEGAHEGLRMLGSAVQQLVDGQSADLEFERRAEVSLAECTGMAQRKTGALFGCSCAIGALFGAADPQRVARLRGFGEQLGLAFQLADDLLGIWGDPAVTGKPVHSDLDNRKKSLPVVAALTSGTAAGAELAQLYHRDRPMSAAELAHAAELVDTAGGRAWARARAEELLAGALLDLAAASPSPRAAAELETLATLASRRDH